MSSISSISLPTVDPSIHTVDHIEDKRNDPQGFDTAPSPNLDFNTEPGFTQSPPISNPSISTSYSQQRIKLNFGNNYSSTTARNSLYTNQFNSQHSIDHLIQSAPLVSLLKRHARNIRSWKEFFNLHYFQLPTLNIFWSRIIKNLRYFIYNYTIIYVSALLLSVIIMPVLLTLMVVFVILNIFLILQNETIHITQNLSFSRSSGHWFLFVFFTALFLLFLKLTVYLLLTISCIGIIIHASMHIGQKYEKLPSEDPFEEDI